MRRDRQGRLLAFAAGLAAMAAAGGSALWWREHADWRSHVERDGLLGPRRRTVAAGEVVDDIRPLDRLVVFRAYVTALTTTHEVGWLTQSDQTMITPAYVNYYVDMGRIGTGAVRVAGDTVTLRLPPLMIERPNIDTGQVLVFNSGLWTGLARTADRLRVANNRMAQEQLFRRADMPFLVNAAEQAARAAVAGNVRAALAAKGHGELAVVVVR